MLPGYKLYPLVSLVAVHKYLVSVTLSRHYGDMYPLVYGYNLIVQDT